MKKINYILSVVVLLFTACTPMEDIYDQLDQNKTQETLLYEATYTGSYPEIGCFTNETEVETAVAKMLNTKFPNKQDGLTAKIEVNFGHIETAPTAPSALVVNDVYQLTNDDYETIGNGAESHHNFSSSVSPDVHLPTFLATKFADKAEGTTLRIIYAYYNKGVHTYADIYTKNATGWTGEKTVRANMEYQVSDEDYKIMGQRNYNFSNLGAANKYLVPFLNKSIVFAFMSADNVIAITWKSYNDSNKFKTSYYKFDGSTWSIFNPYEDTVTISPMVANMSIADGDWKMDKLTALVLNITMTKDLYTEIVSNVKENHPDYVEKKYQTSEFYYGADSYNENISQDISKWKLNDPDNLLDGKSDTEIKKIMNERLVEAFTTIILPKEVETPDLKMLYTINFGIWNGTPPSTRSSMTFKYDGEKFILKL